MSDYEATKSLGTVTGLLSRDGLMAFSVMERGQGSPVRVVAQDDSIYGSLVKLAGEHVYLWGMLLRDGNGHKVLIEARTAEIHPEPKKVDFDFRKLFPGPEAVVERYFSCDNCASGKTVRDSLDRATDLLRESGWNIRDQIWLCGGCQPLLCPECGHLLDDHRRSSTHNEGECKTCRYGSGGMCTLLPSQAVALLEATEKPDTLAFDHPEPPPGSVVLDSDGIAWQRSLSHPTLWFDARHEAPETWTSLQDLASSFGALILLHERCDS